MGLVDGFGGIEEAIAKAAELAKLGNERGVSYLERQATFKEQLIEMLADQEKDEGSAPAEGFAFFGNGQMKLAQALADMRSVLAGPNIQVRCLECPSITPARVQQKDVSFLSAIAVLAVLTLLHQAQDQPEKGELQDVIAAVDRP